MTIAEFQAMMGETFLARDRQRGEAGTSRWFLDEVAELLQALEQGTKKEIEAEMADVMAWLVSLANIRGISLEKALLKYEQGCSRCETIPCRCPEREV